MTGRSERRVTFRGQGPYLLTLRAAGFLSSALLVPVAQVPGRPGLSWWFAGALFILWEGLLFRPRVVVDGHGLQVHWLLRSLHQPACAVESVDLVAASVLWYPSTELCLVVDGRTIRFPWIGWLDRGDSWFGVPSVGRRERFLQRLRGAVATGGDG